MKRHCGRRTAWERPRPVASPTDVNPCSRQGQDAGQRRRSLVRSGRRNGVVILDHAGKFGDCTIRQRAFGARAASRSMRRPAPAHFHDLQTEVLDVGAHGLGADESTSPGRPVTLSSAARPAARPRTAPWSRRRARHWPRRAREQALVGLVFEMDCNVPCDTSGWYGVYAVRNSERNSG